MDRQTVRYLVEGCVQGVFYRAATAERAAELDLDGWVRNLTDGRVEVVAAGEDSAIEALAAWLWQGPPKARVTAVAVEECQEQVGAG
ncbi:MAG TPA: acylphosphatase, partial [Gammaproteobacteria bacterium]